MWLFWLFSDDPFFFLWIFSMSWYLIYHLSDTPVCFFLSFFALNHPSSHDSFWWTSSYQTTYLTLAVESFLCRIINQNILYSRCCGSHCYMLPSVTYSPALYTNRICALYESAYSLILRSVMHLLSLQMGSLHPNTCTSALFCLRCLCAPRDPLIILTIWKSSDRQSGMKTGSESTAPFLCFMYFITSTG